jgi:hypothetical protein
VEEIDVSGATYARGDGGNKVDGWGQYGGTPSLYLADKVDYKSDLVSGLAMMGESRGIGIDLH